MWRIAFYGVAIRDHWNALTSAFLLSTRTIGVVQAPPYQAIVTLAYLAKTKTLD